MKSTEKRGKNYEKKEQSNTRPYVYDTKLCEKSNVSLVIFM